MHGPGVLGKRLMTEGAFCFRSLKVLGPWTRNGAFASVDQVGGDVVVRIRVPPEVLSDSVRWSHCRGRLADAWVRVRGGGCPLPPDLFAEGVLAGAACGDARLVARCIGSVTEYMCRADDYAHALDAVTALNDRAWRESDLARAAPIVVHVTTLLLARAHALATGDRIGGSISMAEAMYDPKDDDMGRLYQCSACHIGAGLERIEAEALRRLFGAFCNDLPARSPEACILAIHIVGLFTGHHRDAAPYPNLREGAVAALVRPVPPRCQVHATATHDGMPCWRVSPLISPIWPAHQLVFVEGRRRHGLMAWTYVPRRRARSHDRPLFCAHAHVFYDCIGARKKNRAHKQGAFSFPWRMGIFFNF